MLVKELLRQESPRMKIDYLKAKIRTIKHEMEKAYYAAEYCGLDDELVDRITALEKEDKQLKHFLALHQA